MSLTSRLRKFVALPGAERTLAVRAIWTLLWVRAGLSLLSFAALRARIERAGSANGAENAAVARSVRRAVERAARTVPGSACLAQAFTAEVMLRQARCQVSASIGVSSHGEPLPAHAWVESSGVIVTGEADDLHTYARLLSFGTPSSSPSVGRA